MRGKHRTSLPVAALLVLTAALTAALGETDTDKTELPGGNPATPEVTILNNGILFASATNPELLVILQLLDGVTTAVCSVMVPLVVADLTRGIGRFNLGQGIVGTFIGIGASASATLAGYISDHFGSPSALAGLAAIAFAGLAAVWFLMPETRDAVEPD